MEYHTGLSMYMVPLKKWEQHGPDSNLTILISLYSKLSFDEGPIFTILYWKAVQGLKHIYVVKNTSSELTWFCTLTFYYINIFCKKLKYKIKPNFSKDRIRPPLVNFSAFLKKKYNDWIKWKVHNQMGRP